MLGRLQDPWQWFDVKHVVRINQTKTESWSFRGTLFREATDDEEKEYEEVLSTSVLHLEAPQRPQQVLAYLKDESVTINQCVRTGVNGG